MISAASPAAPALGRPAAGPGRSAPTRRRHGEGGEQHQVTNRGRAALSSFRGPDPIGGHAVVAGKARTTSRLLQVTGHVPGPTRLHCDHQLCAERRIEVVNRAADYRQPVYTFRAAWLTKQNPVGRSSGRPPTDESVRCGEMALTRSGASVAVEQSYAWRQQPARLCGHG